MKNLSKYTLMDGKLFRHIIPYWYSWTMSNARASWQNYTKGYAVATSVADISRQRPFVQDITGQPRGRIARDTHNGASSANNTLIGTKRP